MVATAYPLFLPFRIGVRSAASALFYILVVAPCMFLAIRSRAHTTKSLGNTPNLWAPPHTSGNCV